MNQFLSLTMAGIATYGCVYALTAMGLVVTYTTSGIFNFAQGAIGMLGAFLFWDLTQVHGWPTWLALVVVVLGFSPLLGAVLERVVVRRLENAGLEARLTVTIALLLLGIAAATAIWDPTQARNLPEFFPGRQVTVGGFNLSWHEIVIMASALLSGVVLRLFFVRTRAGIATRAVVDDRELAALTGATPARYAQLGWALGCALASLAGILIAASQVVNLDVTNLTLLVVYGYAAAMVGRLKSLPWTFAGAIALGLTQSLAIGYLPVGDTWSALEQCIPMAFLLVVILVVPQARAPLGRRVLVRAPRMVGRAESLAAAAGLVVVAVVASRLLGGSDLTYATRGVALAIVLLSLVVLTGYGGQVSLCQLTFAGLGAYAMAKVGGRDGSLLGLAAAVGLSGAVGMVIALPALRVRGLYLALATLAFAEGMDAAFFNNIKVFGPNLSLPVGRPNLPGVSLAGDRAYLVALGVVFAALAVVVLALRRSRYGRRLLAISDSPSACLTLGVDMTRAKLAVFALSAAMAGLGGALYGAAQGLVGPHDFSFILSLTVLLLAVVWGIRTTGGMLLAGVLFALQPLLDHHLTTPRDAFALLVGLTAIGVSQNPEGTFGGNTSLRRWRDRHPRQGDAPAGPDPATGDPSRPAARLTHVAG